MKNEIIPLIQTYDGRRIGIAAKTGLGILTVFYPYHCYCLTNATKNDLEKVSEIKQHPGIISVTELSKVDLLSQCQVRLTRIEGRSPRDIRTYPCGRKKSTVCSILESSGYETWEAKGFRYDLSFIMEKDIPFLMPCSLQDKRLCTKGGRSSNFLGNLKDLINVPLPELSYVCIAVRPTYESLKQMKKGSTLRPVESCAVVDHRGRKSLFTCNRNLEDLYLGFDLNLCTCEIELINRILDLSRQYDIVLSYGGDFLDFRYLWYRARSLGFGNFPSDFKHHSHGLHSTFLYSPLQFDLYRFFNEVSIRMCTGRSFLPDLESAVEVLCQGTVTDGTDPTAQAIADVTKIQKLVEWQNSFFLSFLLILMRLLGRTNDLILNPLWKSVDFQMCKFHKQQGFLIPNRRPCRKKEKKIHGTYENAFVLDRRVALSQLLLEFNISYETVNCVHTKCKKNVLSGNLWVCSERKGVFPLFIKSVIVWLKRIEDYETVIPKPLVRNALLLILREIPECMLYGRFASDPQTSAIQYLDMMLEMKIREVLTRKGIEILCSDAEYLFLSAHDVDHDELTNILQKWIARDFRVEGPFEKFYYSRQKEFMYGSERLPLKKMYKK